MIESKKASENILRKNVAVRTKVLEELNEQISAAYLEDDPLFLLPRRTSPYLRPLLKPDALLPRIYTSSNIIRVQRCCGQMASLLKAAIYSEVLKLLESNRNGTNDEVSIGFNYPFSEFYVDSKSGELVHISKVLSSLACKLSSKNQWITSEKFKVGHEILQLNSLSRMHTFKHIDFERMLFVDGVAGCGKTETLKFLLKDVQESKYLLLSATRKSRNDLKSFKCMTISSALQNILVIGELTLLIIDEATLIHPGLILMIIAKYSPQITICFGDQSQIPYLYREKLFPTDMRYSINDFPFEFLQKSTSYRIPKDIVPIVTPRYGRAISTKSDVSNSVNWIHSKNPVKAAKRVISTKSATNDDILIICYTQKEKKSLISSFPSVLTVHEAEGSTVDLTILLRIDSRPIEIFNISEDNIVNPHQLVAITRHKKSFYYISIVEDNFMNFLSSRASIEHENIPKDDMQSEKMDILLSEIKAYVENSRKKARKLTDPNRLICQSAFITENVLKQHSNILKYVDYESLKNALNLTPYFVEKLISGKNMDGSAIQREEQIYCPELLDYELPCLPKYTEKEARTQDFMEFITSSQSHFKSPLDQSVINMGNLSKLKESKQVCYPNDQWKNLKESLLEVSMSFKGSVTYQLAFAALIEVVFSYMASNKTVKKACFYTAYNPIWISMENSIDRRDFIAKYRQIIFSSIPKRVLICFNDKKSKLFLTFGKTETQWLIQNIKSIKSNKTNDNQFQPVAIKLPNTVNSPKKSNNNSNFDKYPVVLIPSKDIALNVIKCTTVNSTWWMAFKKFMPHKLRTSHADACEILGIKKDEYISLSSMIEAICFWQNAVLVDQPGISTKKNKLIVSSTYRHDLKKLSNLCSFYEFDDIDGIKFSKPANSNLSVYLLLFTEEPFCLKKIEDFIYGEMNFKKFLEERSIKTTCYIELNNQDVREVNLPKDIV